LIQAEIDSALNKTPPIVQTESKVAEKLEEEGFIKFVELKLGGRFAVTIKGYKITLKGNITYCQYC